MISNFNALIDFLSSPELSDELGKAADSSVINFSLMRVLMTGDVEAARVVANKRAEKAKVKPAKKAAFVKKELEDMAAEHSIFKIQLAALSDLTFGLIMGTYALEGDGPLAFVAFEIIDLIRRSVDWNASTPEVRNPDLGQPLPYYDIWSPRPDIARNVLVPAKSYLDGQLAKHAATLKFFENTNKLAPWNSQGLTPEVLDYFVSINLLSSNDRDLIVGQNEINRFRVFAAGGPTQPSASEYLLRDSPDELLPKSRVWRFWYQNQRRIPGLAVLVKSLSPAQPSSGGAERCIGIFRKDLSADASSISNATAQTRIRSHYKAVVDPMARVPLAGLVIYDH